MKNHKTIFACVLCQEKSFFFVHSARSIHNAFGPLLYIVTVLFQHQIRAHKPAVMRLIDPIHRGLDPLQPSTDPIPAGLGPPRPLTDPLPAGLDHAQPMKASLGRNCCSVGPR